MDKDVIIVIRNQLNFIKVIWTVNVIKQEYLEEQSKELLHLLEIKKTKENEKLINEVITEFWQERCTYRK